MIDRADGRLVVRHRPTVGALVVVTALTACAVDSGVDTAKADQATTIAVGAATVPDEPAPSGPATTSVAPPESTSFEAGATSLTTVTIDALGGPENVQSAADVIAELMADRPPLLLPAGVDDVIGYQVTLRDDADTDVGDHERHALTFAVPTTLTLDEVAANVEAALLSTGFDAVDRFEHTDDGRRTMTLTGTEGAADVLPRHEVTLEESDSVTGLIEIEVARSGTPRLVDGIDVRTAPSAVRDVLVTLEPSLGELGASLSGWSSTFEVSEGRRYDTVTVESISGDDFTDVVATIDALGWDRHEEPEHVVWIAGNLWTWSASDDVVHVRLEYEQYEVS